MVFAARLWSERGPQCSAWGFGAAFSDVRCQDEKRVLQILATCPAVDGAGRVRMFVICWGLGFDGLVSSCSARSCRQMCVVCVLPLILALEKFSGMLVVVPLVKHVQVVTCECRSTSLEHYTDLLVHGERRNGTRPPNQNLLKVDVQENRCPARSCQDCTSTLSAQLLDRKQKSGFTSGPS